MATENDTTAEDGAGDSGKTPVRDLYLHSAELSDLARVAGLAATSEEDGSITASASALHLVSREAERISSAISDIAGQVNRIPPAASVSGETSTDTKVEASAPATPDPQEAFWNLQNLLRDIKATSSLLFGASTSKELEISEETIMQTCNRIEDDCDRCDKLANQVYYAWVAERRLRAE